ncbi:response regulator [Cyclobacterium qasimii]|uniref:Two-component response regulator n=2 Tax=Cyclobacterium qasimii TaxID=1350429 RepID=S7VIM0_9BACT|nr:response regulator [Cyclobacterium qasimii]EPR69362.1 Two-component response regulator [Cyclobacterium qasimii M12-11B]GEO22850.1 response regulator [Cyclobacterium qasimii]
MIKIVLIDDDPISIFVTEKLISRNVLEPFKVFSFSSAAAALKDIYKIRPDYLFLDINMPEMNGWDFLETFKPIKKDPEIYILSSSIDELDITKAGQYKKVKNYLTKPLIKQYIKLIFSSQSSKNKNLPS